MTKTIKFNLICDEYPALTIEDLQNHFSVEDLLDYYEKGLLAKRLFLYAWSFDGKGLSKTGSPLSAMYRVSFWNTVGNCIYNVNRSLRNSIFRIGNNGRHIAVEWKHKNERGERLWKEILHIFQT